MSFESQMYFLTADSVHNLKDKYLDTESVDVYLLSNFVTGKKHFCQ